MTIQLIWTTRALCEPFRHKGAIRPATGHHDFSGEPAEVGWNPGRVAQAWAELTHRLGYTRYVAQGGDVGASVTGAMSRQAPDGLPGTHMKLRVTTPGGAMLPAEPEQERAAADAIATFRTSGFGYFLEQATRPQTIGCALLDPGRPGGLDARPRHRRLLQDLPRLCHGQPSGGLTGDHIPDNITVYWLTSAGARRPGRTGRADEPKLLRTDTLLRRSRSRSASPTFPGEIFQAPRSWVEKGYPTSPTSMRPARASTSPPGKSPGCSRPRSARRSGSLR